MPPALRKEGYKGVDSLPHLQKHLGHPQAGGGPARVLLVDAREWAHRLVGYLRAIPEVSRAEVVGSIRRWVETVGDVNLLAASEHPEEVVTAFADNPALGRVVGRDHRSCQARLTNGMAVTLTVEAPGQFAAAFVLSTGSRAHGARLEARARSRGLDLAHLGLAEEAAVYAALDLPEIPPELREDAGEIEAAEAGDSFDDLLTRDDIRGMVHCHTVYSDGHGTVAEMAEAARKMGMEYITITDHSPTASYAGGLRRDQLPPQWSEIAEAQSRLGIRVLRGTESDILGDGSLDYPDEVLGALEVVIASIHDRLRMDSDSMTARLVAAMRQPVFKIWGHALGRLLLKRDPIACDLEKVLDAIAESRAAIELNGSPHRMDLPVEGIRAARRRGIKFVVSTDAHSTAELANLTFAVALARRAGVRRNEVLNTLPADEFAERVRPTPTSPGTAPFMLP